MKKFIAIMGLVGLTACNGVEDTNLNLTADNNTSSEDSLASSSTLDSENNSNEGEETLPSETHRIWVATGGKLSQFTIDHSTGALKDEKSIWNGDYSSNTTDLAYSQDVKLDATKQYVIVAYQGKGAAFDNKGLRAYKIDSLGELSLADEVATYDSARALDIKSNNDVWVKTPNYVEHYKFNPDTGDLSYQTRYSLVTYPDFISQNGLDFTLVTSVDVEGNTYAIVSTYIKQYTLGGETQLSSIYALAKALTGL